MSNLTKKHFTSFTEDEELAEQVNIVCIVVSNCTHLQKHPLFFAKPPPPPLNLQTVQAPSLGNPPYISLFRTFTLKIQFSVNPLKFFILNSIPYFKRN